MKNFFNFIKNNFTTIILLLLVGFIMLWLSQCNSSRRLRNELEAEKQKNTQNIEALTQEIKKYTNAAGQTSYEKPIAQMTTAEIKKYFPSLYQAIISEGSKVQVIITEKIVYRDTGSVNNYLAVLDSNFYALNFNYKSSDSTLKIKGKSTFFANVNTLDKENGRFKLTINPYKTFFDDINMKFGVTTGIKKDKDGLFKIFVTPDNPKFEVIDLKGADVTDYINKQKQDKTKKRWGVGPYIGYGFVFGGGNTVNYGVGAGISIMYNVIRF